MSGWENGTERDTFASRRLLRLCLLGGGWHFWRTNGIVGGIVMVVMEVVRG